MNNGEQMIFTNDLGEEEVFYVQAVTTLEGTDYLLVTGAVVILIRGFVRIHEKEDDR